MENGKMSLTQLREALVANTKAGLEIRATLESRTKANQGFQPGERYEVGQNGDLRLVESAETKRRHKSLVESMRDLGVPAAGAKAVADREYGDVA